MNELLNQNRVRVLPVVLATALALLLALAAQQADAARTDKGAVKQGVKWMRGTSLKQFPGTGFQSDALQALMAARRAGASVPAATREKFLRPVRDNANSYALTAGSAAKVILAAVAGGENPRCFGPVSKNGDERSDFVDALMAEYDAKTGRFGVSAFDHGLALTALKAAKVKIPSRAVRFAKSRRGKYGWGFGLVKSGGDDIESTAVMIQGLRAAGVKKSDSALRAALRWVTYQRNSDGGYNPVTSKTAGETQADATAYVVQAAASMGAQRPLMKKAKRALRALQQRDGSFRAQPSSNSEFKGISTANVVLALSGRHLPVVTRRTPARACS